MGALPAVWCVVHAAQQRTNALKIASVITHHGDSNSITTMDSSLDLEQV
jgi:hypothetical protein